MSVLSELSTLIDELIAIARSALATSVDLDGSAAQHLKRVAEIEERLVAGADVGPRCPGRWQGGMLTSPNAPEHGARCKFPKHFGFCSFMREAIASGWDVPAHVVARSAARFCRLRGHSVTSDDIDVTRDADGWSFRARNDPAVNGRVRLDGMCSD